MPNKAQPCVSASHGESRREAVRRREQIASISACDLPIEVEYYLAYCDEMRTQLTRAAFDDTDSLDEPVWCFHRFGKSITEFPDGRIIEIGGEHEDYYDPDFCIYNDVVVHYGGGRFEIFGYPEEVFPPTDSHSATLVGDVI